jgi:hypothetical protein
MGAIKTTELSNGNIGLEITYGGKEAPFGGVDTSAPPAYIDPTCFTNCDGFIVIDNKLVVASLNPIAVPTLWGGTAGVTLLKFGTFYNSLTGQLNYALGYTATAFGVSGTSPTGVNYEFYMTSWNPSAPTVPFDDSYLVTLFDASAVQLGASITLPLINSQAVGLATSSGATGNITAIVQNPAADPGYGAVSAIDITGGTGYFVGQNLVIWQYYYGAPEQSATAKVATIGGSGNILTTTLTSGGGGSDYSPAYTIGAATIEASSAAFLGLTISGPLSGVINYTVSVFSCGQYVPDVIAAMVSSMAGNLDVTASSSADGLSLVITALALGSAGNAITVKDTSTSSTPSLPPTFYFPARQAVNLQGGQLAVTVEAPRSLTPPASVTEVGGTLYIANLGPLVLKYSGPGFLSVSSAYQGVAVIKKFAGSLIGLRIKPQLGTYGQNQDMIFAWTVAGALDEWNPVNKAGNVTGAGFEQLADIGDYLTGLIVSNGIAFIIRSQGVSYATATGTATAPFNITHLGLGDEGEGAQITLLVCQYDQTGAFVSNTDIYQVSSSLSSIGAKIKASFFNTVATNTSNLYASVACATTLSNQVPLFLFLVGKLIYIYNASNATWQTVTLNIPLADIAYLDLSVLTTLDTFSSSNQFNQTFPVLAVVSTIGTTSFYQLSKGVANSTAVSNSSSVTFPVEEVSFGRDITIDGLYVSLLGNLTESVTLNFDFNGEIFSSLTIPAGDLSLVTPTEFQLFPTSTTTAGAFTAHSPQLSITVPALLDTGTEQLYITKIAVFASYDPKQRPV